MKVYKTIILLPYLPLNGMVQFNGLKLWPYNKFKIKLIKDTALRTHIDKLIGCYQLYKGNPVPNPAIITGDKINFSNPTQLTISKIESLKNILLLLGILENNQWSFITSDNFEVFYQRFIVGETGISTQAGAIHRITTGGYQIGQVAFQKPEHVNLPISFNPDLKILNALEDCLTNSSTNKGKSQIIQSLNPLFNAYRNSHEQSWHSRILLMVMAFELLFGETGRPQLRNNILKYSTIGYSKKFTQYKYPIVNYGKVTGYEQLTLHQIWAEEFYKLRNKIIHGDTVYSDDFIFKDLINIIKPREPYFYISINFFVVCLLNKLRELGFSNVEHYIINPDAPEIFIGKNISGIKNELFKIEDRTLHNLLASRIPN
ncbi:MAG: hypothetical protein ACOX6N_03450 [Patescibacteria group bacterium]|jgi:hypothetical protein